MSPSLAFEREKIRTKECLADVIQLLSHDTSPTRRQLAEVLRRQAELIGSESQIDSLFPEPEIPQDDG